MVTAEGRMAIRIRTTRVVPVIALVWKGEMFVGSSRGPGERSQAYLEDSIAVLTG